VEWTARFVDQVSPGTTSATSGVKAFRAELAAASADLKAFEAAGGRLGAGVAAGSTQAATGAAGAAAAASDAGKAAAGAASEAAAAGQAVRPAWAAGQAQARAAAGAFSSSGKAAAGAGAAAGAAGKAAAGAGAAAAQAGAKGAGALSSITGAAGSAGSALGGLRGGATLLLGALGLAGAMSVTKLALGARGMMQLDAITARAQVNVRQLFRGVDPSPVVRAYNKFSQIFSASTVTGRALGDIFTRSFNALFSAVEKAEPYVTAFAQGIVLGFLYAENAVLRARVALAPYTGALDGVVSSTNLMRVAAVGGGLALAVAAGYAAVAAAPFLAMAAAIAAVAAAFEQATKLSKEWNDESGGEIWSKLKSDLGITSQSDREKEQGITQGDAYDRQQRELAAKAASKPAATALAAAAGASTQAAAAKGADPGAAAAAGQASGAAMAAGMVAGMKAGQGAVAAAGADLAAAADKGVRDKAEIRSPSKLFRRTAEHIPEGAAQGIRAKADDVQRAADEALVPRPPSTTATPGRGGGERPIVHIGQVIAPHVFDPGGLAGFVRGVANGGSLEALEAMGAPST
jgi:hypothetical protein